MQTMERLQIKGVQDADEVRQFDKGRVEIFKLDNYTLGRATFYPGWKWSESLKKTAGTDSCECGHVGYQLQGTMHIKSDDGREYDIRAGETFYIPPGHDGWVVGDEPCIVLDFQGMTDYAKPGAGPQSSQTKAQSGRKHPSSGASSPTDRSSRSR